MSIRKRKHLFELEVINEMHTDVRDEIRMVNPKQQEAYKQHNTKLERHDVILRQLEVQMGKLSQKIHERPYGALSSNTVLNPKGKE